MRNKNAVRATLAGLGAAAGGAILATAMAPVAAANPNTDYIDDVSGTYTSEIFTGYGVPGAPNPLVEIIDNSGSVYTTITGAGPVAVNEVDLYDNTGLTNTDLVGSPDKPYNFALADGNQGTTDLNLTTNGTSGVNSVEIEHNSGPTNVDISGLGAGTTNSAAIFDNTGSVTDEIDGGTGGSLRASIDGDSAGVVSNLNGDTSAVVNITDETGQPDTTTLNDLAGGTIDLNTNSDAQTVDLLANGGTDYVYVNPLLHNFDSGLVNIDAPTDVSPIFVAVQEGTVGAVTVDVGGVDTVIPAGDEYEFVNGAIDIISTSY